MSDSAEYEIELKAVEGCEVRYFDWLIETKTWDDAVNLMVSANCDLICTLPGDHEGPHQWCPIPKQKIKQVVQSKE